MIWFLIFIAICYVVLIVSLTVGFYRVDNFIPQKTAPKTTFSIIIPFRNEAERLPILLQSIVKLDYPKDFFEIIFVDDFSEDNSVEIIKEFFSNLQTNIRIIKNNRISNSPKKDAITTAMKQTRYNWIVTTDADCKLPEKWLETFDSFIQKEHPNMVVGGVNYEIENSFLQRFQLLDFLSLQGTTIGGFGLKNPFLCNGANLAYRKNIFELLKGFDGNNHIASGDDVFLFEKFLKFDNQMVHFLKSNDAMVTTFPVQNWKDLFYQRVRWASKTSKVSSVKTKAIGFIVFTYNLCFLISLLVPFFYSFNFTFFLSLWAIKLITDLILFLPSVNFYNHKSSFAKGYFLSSFLYPIFSVCVVVYSLFFKFKWKGRNFRK